LTAFRLPPHALRFNAGLISSLAPTVRWQFKILSGDMLHYKASFNPPCAAPPAVRQHLAAWEKFSAENCAARILHA
jgi:hypothetical protein